MAKPPAKKQPIANSRPTSKSRTNTQARARVKSSGRPAGLFTWLAVGLVVVVIAVLVGVKVLSGSTSGTKTTWQAASPQIVNDVTAIPASVYNTVGVNSSLVGVTPPSIFKSDPLLTTTVNEKAMPTVLYLGADYCPYCAAERWSVIAALSRFGTWSGLGNMASYSGDVFPNTQTFTFSQAKFKSPYVVFQAVEEAHNYLNAAGTAYASFQVPTKKQNAIAAKYEFPPYFPNSTGEGFPFVSIGNKALIQGPSYSPSALVGLSRQQIASTLSTPSNFVAQAIVATANYITASICYITNKQPGSVCTSKGVAAATKALKL